MPTIDDALSRIIERALRSAMEPLVRELRSSLRAASNASVQALGVKRGPGRPRKDGLPPLSSMSRIPPHLAKAATPEAIVALRKKFYLSQGELAKLIGASLASVSGWESGRSTPREKFCQAMIDLGKKSRKEVAAVLYSGQEPPAPGKRRRGRPRKFETL